MFTRQDFNLSFQKYGLNYLIFSFKQGENGDDLQFISETPKRHHCGFKRKDNENNSAPLRWAFGNLLFFYRNIAGNPN
jgi:hypothetical protein